MNIRRLFGPVSRLHRLKRVKIQVWLSLLKKNIDTDQPWGFPYANDNGDNLDYQRFYKNVYT